MQNASVAALFDEIADYMMLAGENTFKIRAYRHAAEAVATYENPIEEAAEEGTLRSIEGLGEATSEKIQEFLATGKIRVLEELREEFPAGLLDLLRVPGLGPKRVQQLYRERQIDSIEALNIALENNALKGLAGFGPKTIENLKSGLRRLAEMNRRAPLDRALPLSQSLIATLSAFPAIERIDLAGSLRRGAETVGNINLLAVTDDANAAFESFLSLPQALSSQQNDSRSANIRVRPGIDVSLHTTTAKEFGFEQFRVTGSRAHFETAREVAAGRGIELREEGIFRDGEKLAVRDESELYELFGVPFIAPELREGRGEWRAAQESTLPDLVTVQQLRGELHTHSTWSDGSVSIRQMAEAARARGYEYFAVTDHSQALAMTNGLNAERLRAQAEEIAEVQADFPDLKILRGIECDIMRDGSMDLDDEILHELDLVIGSVHSAFNLSEAEQTERVIRAISHPAVDFIAHPTGRILGVRPGYEINVNALIQAALEHEKCLEINSSERLDLSAENAFAAREAGVLLAINSDAHSTRMLPNVEFGVSVARRAWCEQKDILNAKPLDELLRWLNRKK